MSLSPPDMWNDKGFTLGGIYLALWHVTLPGKRKPVREWAFVLPTRDDGAFSFSVRVVHTRGYLILDHSMLWADAPRARALRYFMVGIAHPADIHYAKAEIRAPDAPAFGETAFDWVLDVMQCLVARKLVGLSSLRAFVDELQDEVDRVEEECPSGDATGQRVWLKTCRYDMFEEC